MFYLIINNNAVIKTFKGKVVDSFSFILRFDIEALLGF